MNRSGFVVMDQALDQASSDVMPRRHRPGRGIMTATLPSLPLSREGFIAITQPEKPQERSCARERPTHKYVLDRELEKRNRELERRNMARIVPPPAPGFFARAVRAIRRAPGQVVGYLQQGFIEFAAATKDVAEFHGGILPQDILSNGFVMSPNYGDDTPWPEEADSVDLYVTADTSFEKHSSSRPNNSTYANPSQLPPPKPPNSVLPIDLPASNKPFLIPKIFVNDAELPGSVSPFELPSPVTPTLPAPTTKKASRDNFIAMLRTKPEAVLNAPVFSDDEDEEDRPASQPPMPIPVVDDSDTSAPKQRTPDNSNNNGHRVQSRNSEWQYAPYQTPPQPRLPAHIENSSPQTFFELLEKNPDAVRNASVFSSSDCDEDRSSRSTTNPIQTPASTPTNSFVTTSSFPPRILASLLSDEDRSSSRSNHSFVAASLIPRRALASILSDDHRPLSRSTSTSTTPLPTPASTTTNNSVASPVPSIKPNRSTLKDRIISSDEWEDISTHPSTNPAFHGPSKFRCVRCKRFVCICGRMTLWTDHKTGEVRPGPRPGIWYPTLLASRIHGPPGGGYPARQPQRGGPPGWGRYRTRFERTLAPNEMPGYDPFEGISTSPTTFERWVLVDGVWEKPKKKPVGEGVGEELKGQQQEQQEQEEAEIEKEKDEKKEKEGRRIKRRRRML